MAHWFNWASLCVSAPVLLALKGFSFSLYFWYHVKIPGPFCPIWFEKSSLSLGWISMPSGYKVMMSLLTRRVYRLFNNCWRRFYKTLFIIFFLLNQTHAAPVLHSSSSENQLRKVIGYIRSGFVIQPPLFVLCGVCSLFNLCQKTKMGITYSSLHRATE